MTHVLIPVPGLLNRCMIIGALNTRYWVVFEIWKLVGMCTWLQIWKVTASRFEAAMITSTCCITKSPAGSAIGKLLPRTSVV